MNARYIVNRAGELQEEIVQNRRYIHQNAETGLELPNTTAFVAEKLRQMGYEPSSVGGYGVTALLGDPSRGRTLLLRADMDALPMKEESGLPFASKNEGKAHCCGHDMHTAMLLGAARLLKEREAEISAGGCVKFMFQPGEEILKGAEAMVKAGVLEDPKPDAALALHVNAKSPSGFINYGKGCTFASADNMKIIIHGRGGHGARPHECADPLKALVHIYTALETVVSSEVNPLSTAILTMTGMNSGAGSIPDTASMHLSLKTYDNKLRKFLLERINILITRTAEAFGTRAEINRLLECAPVYVSPEFTDEILGYIRGNAATAEMISDVPEIKMGSEDFCFVSERIPRCAYLFIGAGPDARTAYSVGQHSSRVVFNEKILSRGAAIEALAALGFTGAL